MTNENIGKLIHENDNYKVEVADLGQEINGYTYKVGYAMINKNTGVTEYATPSLPDALYTSEQFNHAVASRAWEWRKEARTQDGTSLLDLVN